MANGHGGRRAGAGRKPGAVAQKTREIADAAAAEGITPLDYMLAVLRDPEADQHRRDEMAKSAAPYMHPRLNTISATVDTPYTGIGQINVIAIPRGVFLTKDQMADLSSLKEKYATPSSFDTDRPMLVVNNTIDDDDVDKSMNTTGDDDAS